MKFCILVPSGLRKWLYDTIRYDTVDLRALKSRRDGQLNLAHGPETKNNEKIKIKNRVVPIDKIREYNSSATKVVKAVADHASPVPMPLNFVKFSLVQ